MMGYLATVLVMFGVWFAGYLAGRRDGADHYRRQEAERMIRGGMT